MTLSKCARKHIDRIIAESDGTLTGQQILSLLPKDHYKPTQRELSQYLRQSLVAQNKKKTPEKHGYTWTVAE